MIPDRYLLILPLVSALVGLVAWSGHVLALPAALLFPLLWSLARTRLQAAAVSAGYFLAASCGLPQGVANFYGSDLWPGFLLWLTASASFVFVHLVLWTPKTGWRRPLRFLIASLVMVVPPFGIMGWAHPFTAAGILFPGWNWLGLLALAAFLAGMTTRHWPLFAPIIASLWIWSAFDGAGPQEAKGWFGLDLEMGAELGRDVGIERQRELIERVSERAGNQTDETIVVLPESTLGFWTSSMGNLWQGELAGTGIKVLAGGAEVQPDGYDNVMVLISATRQEIIYRQRMPVPGSMWQPWQRLNGEQGSARARFFGNPVVRIGDQNVAILICYEQLIVWPVLQSLFSDVDVVIAVGNGWWTNGTRIIDIQRANVEAWGRLFDKPLVLAFNH